MTEQSTGQSLVENVTLTLVSRGFMIATPIVIALAGWFLSDLIQGQREAVRDVAGHVEMVTTSLAALDKRVTAIEASTAARIVNADANRAAIMSRLDDLFRGQSDQNAKLAALTAKVDALKDRMDSRPDRYGQNIPPQ